MRGDTVMRGYLGLPDITLRDGWLHTGDTESLGGDVNLASIDRMNDPIIRGRDGHWDISADRRQTSWTGHADMSRAKGRFRCPSLASLDRE